MIIKEIKIKKLYGFMDKTINFKKSISILVGINGSGKTSVLNLINWLLKPSFQDLCLVEFESIRMKFVYNGEDYTITCTQNEVELTIELFNSTIKKKYNKIQATFDIHPKKLTKNEELKESLIGAYEGLGPEEHEIETWNFLFNELPKPIVIGLDRYLYTDEGEEFRYHNDAYLLDSKRMSRRGKAAKSSPLDKVKQLLKIEHNLYRNKVLNLYSSLNEKIMLSAFDEIFTKTSIETLFNSTKPSVATIDRLKSQVISFLKENHHINNKSKRPLKSEPSIKKVNDYFNNLKNIIKATESTDNESSLLYITNISQFRKINDLVVQFSQFEEDTKQLYHPLKEFLETLNKFFWDSAKEVYFNKESSEIKFNIYSKDGSILDENRDINHLSSGEKQILILLTYLKYNNNQRIFIIDEPELSLHPKWQGEFLDAVDKLMPKESQLILATHSPEVIGDKSNYCTALLPYNS